MVARTSLFRQDIQGLRAVAVLMVIAYHSGLPAPGGFHGVDIFFVLSGFLICELLIREHSVNGKIDVRAFYKRRIRRLVPALSIVLLFTGLASVLLMSPLGPLQDALGTGLAASVFLSNVFIPVTTGEYFDAPAELNPFLHTWSLGVEGQFYLTFPLLLILGLWMTRRNRRKNWVAVILVLAAIGSFGFLILGLHPHNHQGLQDLLGFYSPISRAWEFLVGAVLAAWRLPTVPRKLMGAALRLSGGALLFVTLWIGENWPPYWAVIPVAGTAMLLIAGRFQPTPKGILSTGFLGRIGDWSYSLYLWHWPLLVFSRLVFPENHLATAFAVAVSFAFAAATYSRVEYPGQKAQPFRLGAWSLRPMVLMVVGAMVLSSLFGLSRFVIQPAVENGYFPEFYSGDVGQSHFHAYVSENFYPCEPLKLRDIALDYQGFLRCQQSQEMVTPSFAILGDSHAEHLFVGLAEANPDASVVYYIRGELPVYSGSSEMVQILDHLVESSTIQTVLITAHWDKRGVPEAQLAETISRLTASGKVVFVTDDVPNFAVDPADCKYRKAVIVVQGACGDFDFDEAKLSSQFRDSLRAVVGSVEGARLIETYTAFCEQSICSMASRDILLYRDRHHLNLNGSRKAAEVLISDPELMGALGFRHAIQSPR